MRLMSFKNERRKQLQYIMGNMKTDELFRGKRMVIQCYKEEDDE